MTELFKERPVAKKSSIPWYWVGAFFGLALLGVLLDSKLLPEHVRFIGNPLTCVGIWGAVLCVLFKKDKGKPGHPHQAGIVLAIDERVIVFFLFLFWHSINLIGYDFSAKANLIFGTLVFLLVALSRPEYRILRKGQSWLGKRCPVCDTLLVYYCDVPITRKPGWSIATYCYHCGTNCEGPIEKPLTPTAQENLGGNKAELVHDRISVEISTSSPDPLPYPFTWGWFFMRLPILIGLFTMAFFAMLFAAIFLASGPYLVLKWLFVLLGITVLAFAIMVLAAPVKTPCPHCKIDLLNLAFYNGFLGRKYRYQWQGGRGVSWGILRYCPYCGKCLETPPDPIAPETPTNTSGGSPAD